MIFKTIIDKHWMLHEIYNQYPMQWVERQINLDFDRNPELINTLDHTNNHPITRK